MHVFRKKKVFFLGKEGIVIEAIINKTMNNNTGWDVNEWRGNKLFSVFKTQLDKG